VADGEQVLDVPAKLAARVRVYSQGHGRKTDRDDAVSIGLAGLDGAGILARGSASGRSGGRLARNGAAAMGADVAGLRRVVVGGGDARP
jgi:hypothetical protein